MGVQMTRKPYQGWYKLHNPQKFRLPIDKHMKSYRDGHVQYKSGLELKSFKYADLNPRISEWSLEPFHIPYLSPLDGKMHRYFPDLWLRFETGTIFIVEIKSSSETKAPRKNDKAYGRKLQTFLINQAKWNAAKAFCQQKKANFVILTEKVLG